MKNTDLVCGSGSPFLRWNMSENLQPIDHSAIRVSQISVIVLNVVAFILNAPWLAAFVSLVMLLGTLLNRPGFGIIYHWMLKPAGLVKPEILMDHPQPHRFAQGLGGLFMLAGALALGAGITLVGWGLVWMVAGLAALNALGGFCVGCMVYYWLGRMKLPGFYQSPPAGTLPGMRPKAGQL
jgi:hypothetical protein